MIDIDSTIFIAFLIVNLVLGLFASRGVKTIRGFAVGDKFSTATLVFTIVATWSSGSFFIYAISESYRQGIGFISITVLGNFLGVLLVGTIFAPRMSEFIGGLSIAEAMGNLYGKSVRIITAFSGFIGVSGIIAIQLKIAGALFDYALGVPVVYGVILLGAVITLYSSLGGVKSVTFTDVIQFIFFSIMIPAIAYLLFTRVENKKVIDTFLTNPLFDFGSIFTFDNSQMYYHLYVLLWLAIPSFNPALFQRIAIAKDAKQASKAFIMASLIVFLLKAIICWVGFLILSIYPGISGNDIFKVIILDYTWVIGFKGLILAGIMAMVMSTVDSYINSSSILLTHDLKESLDIKFIRNELFATRVCSIIIGAISILFAMRDGSFLELFIWASLFYMPIVTVPFMMSVFGFRSSGSSVLAGMFAGFVVAMGWN